MAQRKWLNWMELATEHGSVYASKSPFRTDADKGKGYSMHGVWPGIKVTKEQSLKIRLWFIKALESMSAFARAACETSWAKIIDSCIYNDKQGLRMLFANKAADCECGKTNHTVRSESLFTESQN